MILSGGMAYAIEVRACGHLEVLVADSELIVQRSETDCCRCNGKVGKCYSRAGWEFVWSWPPA